MFRITKWIAAPVFAIGLFFAADSPSAKAQGFSLNIGSGYGGYGFGGYGYQAYRPSCGTGYGSGYGYRPSNVFVVPPHQSNFGRHGSHYRGGHYDYHPTEVFRHGNHFDVVPGHYDYHRGPHYGHH